MYITNTTINVKYLIIIPREVDYEDNQGTDAVYKTVIRNTILTTGKRGQKRRWLGKVH
jgi:hypothetical protein